MAQGRLDRDQFFEKLAEMEATDLKKALWTLYWRGAAPLRERVEVISDPQSTEVRDRGVKSPPDPGLVLGEVTPFAALARSGSYLAGDRRVSRRERSRWRHTFPSTERGSSGRAARRGRHDCGCCRDRDGVATVHPTTPIMGPATPARSGFPLRCDKRNAISGSFILDRPCTSSSSRLTSLIEPLSIA